MCISVKCLFLKKTPDFIFSSKAHLHFTEKNDKKFKSNQYLIMKRNRSCF